MEGRPQDQMTIGLIHFMAYPEVMKGEGPIVETLRAICEDDYFSAVEVTTVKDPGVRKEAIAVARAAKMRVGFGAQPVLLGGGHNLNSDDPTVRRQAVDAVRAAMDEAAEWGAEAVAVLSGKDPGEDRREVEKSFLVASLKELCEHSRTRETPPLLLETFDRVEFGKNCLIGPSEEAEVVARQVAIYYDDFGLMLDLSHLPLLGETSEHALKTTSQFLKHVHIGNCVMKQADHPAYGDSHPMFAIPEGENGVSELTEFLRVLIEIGYVGRGTGNIVSFEVKPFGDQTAQEVVQNAKETLDAAWAAL